MLISSPSCRSRRLLGGRGRKQERLCRVRLRPLFLDRGSAHQITHGFRDIRRAVTDPLDRTGHEQHLCVRRNPTWILEHVCEELAKEDGVHRIELGIARPDLLRLQGVPLRVGMPRVIDHRHRKTAEIESECTGSTPAACRVMTRRAKTSAWSQMRSSSMAIRKADNTSRKSIAHGCRNAKTRITRLSISCIMRLASGSL